MAKHKSIWYARIEPSSEPPSIIRFLIKIGCSGREAVLIVVLIALLGFVSSGYIFLSEYQKDVYANAVVTYPVPGDFFDPPELYNR